MPLLKHIVVLDDPDGLAPSDVISFDSLLGADPVDLDEAVAIAKPEDLATVIYTSGTTGPPKGVMITHANVAWTIEAMQQAMEKDLTGSRLVSFLPMAHIAERMVTHYMLITNGYEVTTCPDPSLIAEYMREVHPQVFFAVPRVWEKLYAGIRQMAMSQGEERLALLDAGIQVGLQVARHRSEGTEVPAELREQWEAADAAGLSMVRGLVGLDACEFGFSGAAPIPLEVLEFFQGLGVPISEVYGMSENCGPMTWETKRVRLGTVGPALPGLELKLLEDGEVCCRGGNVVQGYLKDPERTAETFDSDGWLHSGDIGVLDEDGYLRIVDRKKELIITAGGKNVSPANVEAALKAFPLIGQACLIGDNKPYLTALIVLDPEITPAWATGRGIDASGGMPELAAHPDVIAEVERSVNEANKQFNNVEQVKRHTILATEWLPDSEELTPTMKLKRRGVHAKYAEEIASMYS